MGTTASLLVLLQSENLAQGALSLARSIRVGSSVNEGSLKGTPISF